MDAQSLLQALADGEYHSGEELAGLFGVTRAAVWKHVGKIERWGVALERAPGVGYRLARPLDLLAAESLAARLPADVRPRIARLEVHTELDSTNAHLLRGAPPRPGCLDVCVAEYQHAGRGRQGRRWTAPLGAGLCLSAGWQFAETPPDLPALALAVGVVVRRAIAAAAGVDAQLKWPNDLVWDDRKLGGVLVELSGEAHGRCHVVAGVGINVAMPAERLRSLSDWRRGAADLAQAAGGEAPAREALAAALVAQLARLFIEYAAAGFATHRAEWRRADYLRGRPVRVKEAGRSTQGVALGIDDDGALLLETAEGERKRIVSGDVSVRPSS